MRNSELLQRLTIILFAIFTGGCASISKPYLYSVERDGKERAVVLGTVHMGVSIHEMPASVMDRFRASKAAYFETYLPSYDKITDERIAEELYYIKSDEPTLDKRLSAEEWKKFVATFPKFSEEMLKSLNLRGAATLLAGLDQRTVNVSHYEYYSMQPRAGLDYRLTRYAEELGINIFALEAGEGVCKEEFDAIYAKNIRGFLRGERFDPDIWIEELRNLLEAYRDADDARLAKLSDFSKDNPLFRQCLLGTRNREWLKELKDFLRNGENIFIAVGVAHLLPGKEPSFLELLRDAGYTIKRIED